MHTDVVNTFLRQKSPLHRKGQFVCSDVREIEFYILFNLIDEIYVICLYSGHIGHKNNMHRNKRIMIF